MRSVRERRSIFKNIRGVILASGGYPIEGTKQFLLGAYPKRAGVELDVEAGKKALSELIHSQVKVVQYKGSAVISPQWLATPPDEGIAARARQGLNGRRGFWFRGGDVEAEGGTAVHSGEQVSEAEAVRAAEILSDLWISRPSGGAAIKAVCTRIRATFSQEARAYVDLLRNVDVRGKLQGIGVGNEAGHPVLQLFVSSAAFKTQHPLQLKIDGRSLAVRLVESGPIVQEDMGSRHHGRRRPVSPGSCISASAGGAGTLTAGTLTLVVEKTDRPGEHYILSCAHVMARGKARRGEKIYQPCHETCGKQECIARLEEAVRSVWYLKKSKEDAAIAKVEEGVDVDTSVSDTGITVQRAAPGSSIVLGAGLQAFGANNHSLNLHVRTLFSVTKVTLGDGSRQRYRNLVGVDRWSEPGDSGGLILTKKHEVAGMHMGATKIHMGRG